MQTTSAEGRVASRRWRMRFASVAFICVFSWLPLAGSAQDSPATAVASSSKPPAAEAGPPDAVVPSNAPRQPAKLANDVARDHAFTTDREERLSFSILLFGFFVLVVQYLLLRRPPRQSRF